MKAIQSKYIFATNTKPVRMTAWDQDRFRVTMTLSEIDDGLANQGKAPRPNTPPADTDRQRHDFIARALCKKMNWHGGLVSGSIKGGYVHVFAYKT